MRMMTTERLAPSGAALVALGGLAWSALPGDGFWSAVIAACLVGSAVATALVLRSRSIPSLAQVISSAEADPATAAAQRARAVGAVLLPAGEHEP